MAQRGDLFLNLSANAVSRSGEDCSVHDHSRRHRQLSSRRDPAQHVACLRAAQCGWSVRLAWRRCCGVSSRPSAIRVRKPRSDEGVRGEIGDREQFRVSDSSLEDRRLARPFGLTETCTQSMSKLQCPECRAIYLDLSELMRAERKRAGAFDPTQFREWMQSLSKTDWAELRKSVMGSSGWQRFRK